MTTITINDVTPKHIKDPVFQEMCFKYQKALDEIKELEEKNTELQKDNMELNIKIDRHNRPRSPYHH